MIILLLLVIIAILLFGSAAFRHAIGKVLLFLVTLAAVLTLWFTAPQISAREWEILGAVVFLGAISLVAWSTFESHKAKARTKGRALEKVWQTYELRGVFEADHEVRRRAATIMESGDQGALGAYCSDEEKRLRAQGYLPEAVPLENGLPVLVWPPGDSVVRKVWSWHQIQIEAEFDEVAKLRARKYYQANDANALDRFCRSHASASREAAKSR